MKCTNRPGPHPAGGRSRASPGNLQIGAAIEPKLFRRASFFLRRPLGWRRPRGGSSRAGLFAPQIGCMPLALGSYTVLLSHGISID